MVWFYPESSTRLRVWTNQSAFQSHYGLILSPKLFKLPKLVKRAFNPTMVWFYLFQLKHQTHFQLSIPLWSDFISIGFLARTAGSHAFQSHYGLILSPFLVFFVSFFLLTFNPTMVWFYHLGTICLSRQRITFNPTMVWFYHFRKPKNLYNFSLNI